jgi:pimeloyl-ACP methyl ester carboxylesterase
MEFVLAYPERVRTLTLVEPAAYWVLEQLGEEDAEVARVNEFIHGLAGREVTEEDLVEFLRLAGFSGPGDDVRKDPNWARWLPHRMALSWQSEELDRSGRSIDELANIRCPALLVKGTVTTDWENAWSTFWGDRLPTATLLELPGDHAAHIQSIHAFLQALERHLASARPRAANRGSDIAERV